MRRPALVLLTLTVALFAAGVLPAVSQDKPRSGGELVFVVPSEPPSYDGHQEETFGVTHPIAPSTSENVRTTPRIEKSRPPPSLWTKRTIGSSSRLSRAATASGMKRPRAK